MLRKTIMFTKNTLFDCVHARCARSTTSRTKSFRHDDDADGAGISRDITLRKIILRNANMVTCIRACAVGNTMRARITRDIQTMA